MQGHQKSLMCLKSSFDVDKRLELFYEATMGNLEPLMDITIQSFIQHMFVELLLCVRHCVRQQNSKIREMSPVLRTLHKRTGCLKETVSTWSLKIPRQKLEATFQS